MYKMRDIATQTSGEKVKGLTVPNRYAILFPNTYFNLEKSGTALVFTSGAKEIITQQQVEEYQFEDCRV